MNESVVYKRGGKWYTGTIKDFKLRKKKQIKKLGDVTDTQEYITLKRWIKENKKEYNPDEIYEKLNVQALYIKKVEKEKEGLTRTAPSAKQFWAKYNSLCLKCKNNCKQSSRVTIVNCNRIAL